MAIEKIILIMGNANVDNKFKVFNVVFVQAEAYCICHKQGFKKCWADYTFSASMDNF